MFGSLARRRSGLKEKRVFHGAAELGPQPCSREA